MSAKRTWPSDSATATTSAAISPLRILLALLARRNRRPAIAAQIHRNDAETPASAGAICARRHAFPRTRATEPRAGLAVDAGEYLSSRRIDPMRSETRKKSAESDILTTISHGLRICAERYTQYQQARSRNIYRGSSSDYVTKIVRLVFLKRKLKRFNVEEGQKASKQHGQRERHMASQIVNEVVAANDAYAANFGSKSELALPPARGFAILTCMDARLDPRNTPVVGRRRACDPQRRWPRIGRSVLARHFSQAARHQSGLSFTTPIAAWAFCDEIMALAG
jgi:hypothetical protein